MKEKQEVSSVVEQELALKVYIDSLLIEPAPQIEQQTETVIAPPEAEVDLKQEQTIEQQHEIEVQPDTILESEATPPSTVDSTIEGSFECLMFQVAGGLQLSVPLVHLNGILQWQGECTPLPGHAEWFLGLVSNRGKQVKVIDIAKFVIPENHQAREKLSGERDFKHLILIDDGRFGLACDGLGDVLRLEHDQVRWRSDRSSRPWLAGTVIDKMCALIDVDQFVGKLKEGISLDDI